MSEVLLIRHGVTAWNAERRMQGRSDIPLTREARDWLACRTVPAGFEHAGWRSSPLARARDSALLLGARRLLLEQRLLESDWGTWEGQTLAELRAADREGFSRNEQRALDFRPPGGESPRDVAARLREWFARVAADGEDLVVVTHKGVIRAALSLATGWDMREDFRPRVDWRAGHHFSVAHRSGDIRLVGLNLPLVER